MAVCFTGFIMDLMAQVVYFFVFLFFVDFCVLDSEIPPPAQGQDLQDRKVFECYQGV